MGAVWRKCSSCKESIEQGRDYYACSVSTCNSKRKGYAFCSIPCFERHLPGAMHRDAAAVMEKAPYETYQESLETRAPRRIIASSSTATSSSKVSSAQVTSGEVLVIASRLKDYIQKQSGFNTSQSVMNALSDHLRRLCDEAMKKAEADGRKTVMDRDFRLP